MPWLFEGRDVSLFPHRHVHNLIGLNDAWFRMRFGFKRGPGDV